jgi:hypothetical protein
MALQAQGCERQQALLSHRSWHLSAAGGRMVLLQLHRGIFQHCPGPHLMGPSCLLVTTVPLESVVLTSRSPQ